MDAVCSARAGFDALEALKLESLAVETAFLAGGWVYLLLLAMGSEHSSDSVLAFDQRRNADYDTNETEAKDAEENGDVDEDDSEDGDDGGGSEGEDSEGIAEDDDEEDQRPQKKKK